MRAAVAVLAILGVCAGAGATAQTNLGDLRDAPSGKFTAEDFDKLWAAVDEVSRTHKVGSVSTWQNTATGSGGSIKLLNEFSTAEGRKCMRVRMDNHAKALKGSSKQIVCASPDGKWMLDAGARPAAKPAPAQTP